MQSSTAAKGDRGKIALMYSQCILLCVILRVKQELLILQVKLTTFMKCHGGAQIVPLCCSGEQQSDLTTDLDHGCHSQTFHAHRTHHFYEASHYNFPWYLMIGDAAEREPQSGQLITDPASGEKRDGVIRGNLLRD